MKSKVLVLAATMIAVAASMYPTQEAEAATATLSWIGPTQCTDGSPVSNCAVTGFDTLCLSMRPVGATADSACATPLRNVANAAATSFTYDVGTPPAQGAVYTFAVRAKSASGDSSNSNTATKSFSARVPNAPTGLTVAQLLEMDESAFTAYLDKPIDTILVDVLIREETYRAGPRNNVRVKRVIKEIVRFEQYASL